MKAHDLSKSVWIITILALSKFVMAAGNPAPVSLTPEGKSDD